MAKKTFIALEPIRHDGEDYAPGAPISLEAALGAKQKTAGIVRDVTADDKVPKAKAEEPLAGGESDPANPGAQ